MTRIVTYLIIWLALLLLLAACGPGARHSTVGLTLDAPSVLAARASATPPPVVPIPAIPAEMLAGLSTEEQLHVTTIPPRDLRDLTLRLNPGLDMVPLVVNETTPVHEIGDRINFWVLDTNTAAKHEVTAELVHKTDVAYAWVEVDQAYDPQALAQSVDRFSEVSYPNEVAVFGSEWHPGIDNDPRLHILYTTGMGSRVAGYFSSSDEYPVEANPYSNEKEMFYISLDALAGGLRAYEYHETVLAHEFQHMIHWNKDRAEDVWINEGLSEYAQEVAHYAPDTIFVSSFATEPDLQLTTWESPTTGSNAPHYASAYLFVAYLAQRFGDTFLSDLVAEPANGMDGVTAALQGIGQDVTDEELFADWVIANFADAPDALGGNGQFGYRQFQLPDFGTSAVHDQYPVEEPAATVHNYGTDYIKLMGEGELTFQFSGSTETRLAAVASHNGDRMWWSNRGDYANPRLTRRFDLGNLEAGVPVTMTAALWWDIEADYDYGYVMASRDGAKWEILPGQRTHFDAINGNGLGPGYTGQSADAAGSAPGWVNETYDLSAYAGGPLWLQFSYVTDDAVNANGWFVDDVAIPAIDYATGFESDADIAGWQSEGWLLTDNQLPQRWLVQLMEFEGPALTTLHRIPIVEGQATVDVDGLGGDRYAVIAISGLTPGTTEQATYQYSIRPREVK